MTTMQPVPRLIEQFERGLDAPSARQACQAAGVSPAELPAYATALETLASSQMIRAREAA